MTDKTFNDALRENIEGIAGSAAFVQIYHPSMQDFEKDPWPAIQLAIAILLDKPIVIAAIPGRALPPKLEKIADKVIVGDVEAIGAGITDYMRSVESDA